MELFRRFKPRNKLLKLMIGSDAHLIVAITRAISSRRAALLTSHVHKLAAVACAQLFAGFAPKRFGQSRGNYYDANNDSHVPYE
jgi:hypothetical protein